MFALLLMVACQNDEIQTTNTNRPELIKKWQQTAYLADPGDGSGTWQSTPESSPVTLEFTADGRVLRNQTQTDTYKVSGDTILLGQRQNGYQNRWLIRELTDDGLELALACIEPCGERYKAVR